MNFISSDAAYSLYPVQTFENRTSLAMPSSRSSATAIHKYVKRGWRIYYIVIPGEPAFFLGQVRWVGDKHTWRLPLDQTGIQERPPLSPTSAPLTLDPVLLNGWKLRPSRQEDGIYEYHYYPIRTTLFRYNYVIPDEALSVLIRDWALRQGRYYHWQVSKEDWAWYVTLSCVFMCPVLTRSRFDADIPAFFQEK